MTRPTEAAAQVESQVPASKRSIDRVSRLVNRGVGVLVSPLLRRRRPIVSSVRDWIDEGNRTNRGSYSYELLHEGGVGTRRPPHVLSGEPHADFAKRLSFEVPDVFVARLPGARVVGTDGLVVTPDGRYLVESTWEQYWLMRDDAYRLPVLPRRRSVGGRFTSVISTWCRRSYYHWMCDAMPRLWAVEQLPDDVRILVPDDLTSYQAEALELAGVPAERLVAFGNENRQLEDFYFASVVGRSGNIPPWVACWLRDRLVGAVGTGHRPASRTRRLYISRSLTTGRRVINEDEVMEVLGPLGFESVHCEQLSLREQIRLFSEAETVVAPHGAGNTNMLYASPGATLIEFQEPGLVHVCYWSLCEALGHEYWYIMATPGAGTVRGADMVVPVDELREVLGRVMDPDKVGADA